MTSTTSSKFKEGRSFFLWSLYTGKTTMIIYLALLTFMCTVVTVFGLGLSIQTTAHSTEIWQAAAIFTAAFTEALAFVFTFVFSIKEFSYLHDKRKTDMFGALPASRRTIFFSKLAAIIVQSTVPMILIMTFLAIMNGGKVDNLLDIIRLTENSFEETNLWYLMLTLFVGLVANAVFMGFLSVCCGKTADKVLSYIIINAAYPVAALLLQIMPSSFLLGYSVQINEWLTCAFSPCTATSSINPIYWGVFAVAFGVLSFFLLPHRKAECAQSYFAFKAPLIITKVLVSFASGMVSAYLFGIIFSAIGGDKIAFVIGMLLGSFIAYFVIQIIFAKGFKGFGWGMIPYAALVVCFAVIMVVLNTGMFGYENYVPSVDEVESMSLVGDKEVVIDGKNVLDGKITDKKEIEECINGQKEIIEFCKTKDSNINERTSSGFHSADNNYTYFDIEDVQFSYKLKNGRTVNRYYAEFSYEDNLDFLKSETYLKYTNSLFLLDPKYSSDVTIYASEYFDDETENYDEYYADDYVEYDTDEFDEDYYNMKIDGVEYTFDESYFYKKSNRIELIEALKQDILENGTTEGKEICEVEVEYGEGDIDSDTYSYYDSENVFVRSTYKNTIELLKKSGENIDKNNSL